MAQAEGARRPMPTPVHPASRESTRAHGRPARVGQWLAHHRSILLIAFAFTVMADPVSSVAYAVSGDGSVVVGLIVNTNFTESAILWDASNVAHILPGLGATSPSDGATGITEDGTIAVGYSRNGGGLHHAVYWTGGPTWASPVVHDLGVLPGASNNESVALGCSSNASLIVGLSEIGGGVSDSSACVWSDFGAPAAIPAGPTGNAAITCSPDGAVIVGGTAAFVR